MYIPPAFNEPRLDIQHALMRAHPLALLITSGEAGPVASPLPFTLLQPSGDGLGILQSHCSRANTHWQTLDGAEALVVFQGVDTYITPSWYESKQEHGKVVPTWNYAIVQARGTVRVIQDTEWLRAHVSRLTDEHESPRPEAWQVTDAPDAYIDALLKGIVGIEIPIRQIDGKWKVSQNRVPADRRSVAEGAAAAGHVAMADMVRRHGGVG
jgi:transcriptional regulator